MSQHARTQNQSPHLPRPRWIEGRDIALPRPADPPSLPLDACLRARKSVREFSDRPVTFEQAARLLWAAQGVTRPGGLRTAPSAAATYPLRSYLLAGAVEGLAPGVYRYEPDGHLLRPCLRGDLRPQLEKLAGGQEAVGMSALALLLAADYRRITQELGERGRLLAHLEAGHAGQNFLLEAVSLGLGALCIGKLECDLLAALLRLGEHEHPLYALLAGVALV